MGAGEDFQFRYFAGAFSDTYRYIKGLDASIIAERFGLGIDIDLKVTDIESSIKGALVRLLRSKWGLPALNIPTMCRPSPKDNSMTTRWRF